MRNKTIVAAMVFGFLILVAVAILSLIRGSSAPLPAEHTTTATSDLNTSSESTSIPEETSSRTLLPDDALSLTPAVNQTQAVSNGMSMTATATLPRAISDSVSIVIDKGTYTVGETIVVTVTNHLDVPITTVNQQAFCTVIRMESGSDGTWQEVKNCFSGEPVAEFTIAPGTSVTESLPAFAAGTYRVGIRYSVGDAYDLGNLLEIFTLPFDVNG